MLTYNEQLWLAWKKRISRTKNVSAAWCHKCPQHGRNAAGCYGEPYCPLFPDLADALEFEGRVTAKLAEFYHHTTLYLDDSDGQKLRCWETCPARFYCGDSYTHLNCGDAVLKTAQLAVEEEMDAE